MRLPAVALFVKGARPGNVKTRLVPPLSLEHACAMHRAFAEDLVQVVAGLAAEPFVFTDDVDDPFVGDLARRAGMPLLAQHPGNLGDRMLDALARLTPGRRGGIIVGSDSPTLPPAFLREAVERVADGVVLGPALDGGYYLIGGPRPVPELFSGIPWSTPHVLAETLTRAAALGHPFHLLPFWYDVDTAGELALLGAHLATLPRETAPRTRLALEAAREAGEAPDPGKALEN